MACAAGVVPGASCGGLLDTIRLSREESKRIMKLRVGNGCWHAGHVQAAMNTLEAGFFAQEGLDVEVVHAKINPKGLESSRPDGERYDEVGTVLRDMIAFNIDIIPDVHVRTPFAERALGNDELRIIGGWRNWFPATLVTVPGIKSIKDLKGRRVGDWYRGGIANLWLERQMRLAGLDPDRKSNGKSVTNTARCVKRGNPFKPARPTPQSCAINGSRS